MTQPPPSQLEAVLELILKIAHGDFGARVPLSERRDEIDAIVVGLNLLAEDLANERAGRLRAEEQLQDAVDGYENAPALFCSVDAATDVVTQCNRTLMEALGRSRHEVVTRRLHELYAPTSHGHVDECLRALREGASLAPREHELLRSGRPPLVALLSGSVVRDASGAPLRLRLLYRDVTVERHLEAQLLQSQKLEGIGRLAGGIAHDFNNLLMSILGLVDMLRPVVPKGQPAEDLKQIAISAQRGAELTRQLLAFSRRSAVRPVVLDVGELLVRTEWLLRRTVGVGIQVAVDVAPDTWAVEADPARLEQVVLNLAINSRDAMPAEGGRITLEAGNVTLGPTDAGVTPGFGPGEYVRVAVTDTGVGMSRDVRERAFEPFFTTKDVGKGTGLGLSQVYGIVQQASGSVTIDSDVGAGTTVAVFLPRARTSVVPVATPSASTVERYAARHHETVLVVDDESVVRDVAARILREAGYTVVEAQGGRAALELLRARPTPVDLIVSDVLMPDLDGPGLARALAAEGRLGKILFMSGVADHKVDGALLPKPFTSSALLASVREVLDA